MPAGQSFPDKPAARNFARSVWREFLADESNAVRWRGHLDRLLGEFSQLHPGGRLLAYLPLPDEPDIGPACASFRGRVYLPVVGRESNMDFRLYREAGGAGRQETELVAGRFKMFEPAGGELLAEPLTADDLVLVPGLAVAGDGARLGRGGGFYDRWRERLEAACLVGVLPAALQDLDFPPETHDLRLNRVVTEIGLVDY